MKKCLPLILVFGLLLSTKPVSGQAINEISIAQKIEDVYQIPFSSTGNRVELAVDNIGDDELVNVEVIATSVPNWLNLAQQEIIINSIGAGSEAHAIFDFSVGREAPIDIAEPLSFMIRSNQSIIGRKEFFLVVQAPAFAKLDQNYPNPSLRETTIGFDIPGNGNVKLGVYDVLGRQVALLLDEQKPAGHHKVNWYPNNVASGMYLYVLSAEGAKGEKILLQKQLVLVK